MSNIYDYVEKYGNKTFDKFEFNDLDNLVFSSLSYLDFTNTSINNGKYSLGYIAKEYISQNKYQKIKKLGIAQRDAYKLITLIINKTRYKNIELSDYIYNTNKNMQFSAITFKISNKLKYICFEGTDELISGWKEDGELACFFPIPSHLEAINYVNNHTYLLGPNIIIGGHSKGGNLALVAAMYMKNYKKIKVKKVYSNDGPGLRKKEFESSEYRKLKRKYIHIVPDASIVGVLLRNDTYTVVKSTKNNIFAHAMATWLIEDDHLLPGELSKKSQMLQKSIISWLDKHDDEERIKFVNTIFKLFEDLDINDLVDAKKIKNVIRIVLGLKNLDKQTKDLIIDLLTYNYKNIIGKNSIDINK